MIASVTGHRPDKLYGYNLTNPKYETMKENFKKILRENGCTEAITGMALGVDTIFALAVLELKEEGYDIKLHCAVPCNRQCCKWNQESIDQYYDILSKADVIYGMEESKEKYIELILEKEDDEYVLIKKSLYALPITREMKYFQTYKPYLMQVRNEYMVNLADKVIAVWDGSSGGTGNCVAYAKKKEKEIIMIDPSTI